MPAYVCTARWRYARVSTPVIASYQLQWNERTVISANDYDGAFSGRVDLAGREGYNSAEKLMGRACDTLREGEAFEQERDVDT